MAAASRIYHDAIKALANDAIGQGTLEAPDARAFLDNPLCGDCVEVHVKLRAGAIAAMAHHVRGCLLCRASASLIAKHATGATLADIARIAADVATMLEQQSAPPAGWEELAVFAPVHGHPSRYGCVTLPFKALIAALEAGPAAAA